MSDLFGGELKAAWEEHWWGMPEFTHEDLKPYKQIIVSFANLDEMKEFSAMIGQTITHKTQSVWFRKQPIGTYADKSYE